MEIRHLEAFQAVALERNFTKAAGRLHMSQPPLTRLVKQLETELGVRLFARHKRGADLTVAGQLLLGRATSLLREVGEFVSTVSRAEARSRSIRVAIAPGLLEVVLSGLESLSAKFSLFSINAEDIASELQDDALKQGAIDIGIRRGPSNSTDVASKRLFRERFVVLQSDRHPLWSGSSVTAKTVLALPLIYATDDLTSRDIAALSSGRVQHVPEVRTINDEAAIPLAIWSTGAPCIALASKLTRSHAASGISILPVKTSCVSEVRVVWRKNETQVVVNEFAKLLRAAARSHR